MTHHMFAWGLVKARWNDSSCMDKSEDGVAKMMKSMSTIKVTTHIDNTHEIKTALKHDSLH